MSMDASSHYDRVTRVWRDWLMGQDLHFGYFRTAQDTLAQATAQLTEEMIKVSDLRPEHRVLDAGCGVGGPALTLATKIGCEVTGISTSEEGLAMARSHAKDVARDARLRFIKANAMDHDLPSESYDRVWSLESCHLMHDQESFFRECFRVLRPAGKLALCDVCLVGDLTEHQAQIEGYRMLGHSRVVARNMHEAVQTQMLKTFGPADMRHSSRYVSAAVAAGFANLEVRDISAPTRRTLERWGQKASEHRLEIEAALGAEYWHSLFLALLHMSFGWGRLGGYLLLTAEKPQSESKRRS